MLNHIIEEEIKEKGPLPQSRFMELALQHPLHGYYRSQEAIAQDFTTSPEISQIFGELIGIWALDFYIKLGQPKTLSLIELGPGKGTLMSDLLRATHQSPAFFKALNIYLIEINPLLKKKQLKNIHAAVKWVERFEDIPPSSNPTIIIANEFFDALPTDCYIRQNNILYKRCIDVKKDKFIFTHVALREDLGSDHIWEESPASEALLHAICAHLLKNPGVFLCIDYGYEQGGGDSFQALFRKTPSSPLSHVGKSDLTCHVNFGQFKEISLSKGLKVEGPLSQGCFLKNMGLDVRKEILKDQNPSYKTSLELAAMRLTHPQQMGTIFKAMAIFSPSILPPIGFAS